MFEIPEIENLIIFMISETLVTTMFRRFYASKISPEKRRSAFFGADLLSSHTFFFSVAIR